MKLFGQIISTAVNVVKLPVSVFRDVADPDSDRPFKHLRDNVSDLKREASEGTSR